MANRYINANYLIQDIEQSRANNGHNNVIASQTHNAEHRHFIKMVLDQPDVDVVEVVRCRDCIYWKGNDEEKDRAILTGLAKCIRPLGEWTMNADCNENDYCSCGKRKSN